MASTKTLSALSCAIPALPALTYSRVICNTLGTDALPTDFSCAADKHTQLTASDNPNAYLLNFFIVSTLLFPAIT
jgi:hypothetical protein